MATEHPAAQFIGLDKVRLFPKTIRPANVSFEQRDVTLGLPYKDNTFDLVHMRLFLMAFNKFDYDECLKEVYRVTKPNGIFQLMEVEMIVSCCTMYNVMIIFFAIYKLNLYPFSFSRTMVMK